MNTHTDYCCTKERVEEKSTCVAVGMAASIEWFISNNRVCLRGFFLNNKRWIYKSPNACVIKFYCIWKWIFRKLNAHCTAEANHTEWLVRLVYEIITSHFTFGNSMGKWQNMWRLFHPTLNYLLLLSLLQCIVHVGWWIIHFVLCKGIKIHMSLSQEEIERLMEWGFMLLRTTHICVGGNGNTGTRFNLIN